MKKALQIILTVAVYIACAYVPASAVEVKKVEPLNWWVGMKTSLQVMFYGEGVGKCQVDVEGLKITGVHTADSPNYLFVDVEIPANTKPGTYTFQLTDGTQKTEVPYQIMARQEGSAQRKGFNSSDMIMLYMPDRFANGDPGNDSTDDTAEKAERANDNGRHGGDIQGVIDHLDYLEGMGVTAIWATPLLQDNEPRTSYHGYACSDYYHIDSRYGSNDLFKDLVSEAHKHGIKVIMDVVTNHCGTAHWWMNDYPFKDWINPYTRNSVSMSAASDPNASKADLDIFQTSWFAPSMPDMNLANPFVVKYFTQWAIWWVEWSGLDSFRVDTYPYNDKNGSSQWCYNVRSEYPNISIVGECWQGQPHMVAYWDGDSHNSDGYSSGLTSVMDFPLYSAITSAMRPPRQMEGNAGPQQNQRPNRGSTIDGVYNVLTQDFVYPDPNKVLIFAGNHDTNRIADDFNGEPQRVKNAMTLIATLRGIPQLYYGDELLFRSANQERPSDGAKRVDFMGGWKEDSRNLFNAKERTADEQSVYQHIATLFNWRKNAEVIHTGKTLQFKPTNGVYTFFRYNKNTKVMVVVNVNGEATTVDWDRVAEITTDIKNGVDIISQQQVTVGQPFTIGAMDSAVIEFKL